MMTTRKLPRNTTKKGGKTARGEYLLPQLSGDSPSGFIGMRSGRTFERGYLIYLASKMTPERILDEFCEHNTPPRDLDLARKRLSAFVEALQTCKIGNLLSISYTSDGLPMLKVEQEFLLMQPDKRLP